MTAAYSAFGHTPTPAPVRRELTSRLTSCSDIAELSARWRTSNHLPLVGGRQAERTPRRQPEVELAAITPPSGSAGGPAMSSSSRERARALQMIVQRCGDAIDGHAHLRHRIAL